MRLLSPIDDFLTNTLSALGSLLDRLEYVAGLQSEGKYQHWGLSRTYGEQTAHEVIEEVHRFNYLETLRSPLKVLADEVSRGAEQKGLDEASYVRDLSAISPKLTPKTTAGSAKHLESVLAALLKIVQNRKRATHRVA
jgi:hypothetical protein